MSFYLSARRILISLTHGVCIGVALAAATPSVPVGLAKSTSAPTLLPPTQPYACQALVEAIPVSISDPIPFLAAAACLRAADSSAPIRAVPGALLARLPGDKEWYLSNLRRFQGEQNIPHLLDMAYLAEARSLPQAEIYREAATAYILASDPFRAGLAYLRQAELDSMQAGNIQSNIATLLATSVSEISASRFLDSLTRTVAGKGSKSAQILERLCWDNRFYAGAYRNFMARSAMSSLPAQTFFETAQRFYSLGFYDYAAQILEKFSWRQANSPLFTQIRILYLRTSMQLQDWQSITNETVGASKPPDLSDEEAFIVATALVRLAHSAEAMPWLQRLEKAAAPWGFRAKLLKAQALASQGKFSEADAALDALKKDPQRQEATGPILFWQSYLALQRDRFAEAESLLVLASAYTGNDEAQRALEYRYWLLQDSGEARKHFFRGLPESPLPRDQRMASLDRIPAESGLWPAARLEKAKLLVSERRPDSALAVLVDVVKRFPEVSSSMAAGAQAAYIREKMPGGRDSALALYEDLLVKHQQGVIPEFSRGRIKALK